MPRIVESKVMRFQSGGLNPAYVSYDVVLPVTPEAKTTTKASSASGSGASSAFDMDDMKDLLSNALPSDAKVIMHEYGKMMSLMNTDWGDMPAPYSLSSMLSTRMLKLYDLKNSAKENLEDFKKLRENIHSKGATSDIAQDQYGRVFYMNDDGSIGVDSIDEVEEGKPIMTYGDLLKYRYANPRSAYNVDIQQVLANAVSFKDIYSNISTIVKDIGDHKITTNTFVSSENASLPDGIKAIIADGRKGIYKISQSNKSSTDEQKALAIQTVFDYMNSNERNALLLRAKMQGISPQEMIARVISMTSKSESSITGDLSFDYEKDDPNKKKSGSTGLQNNNVTISEGVFYNLGTMNNRFLTNGSNNNQFWHVTSFTYPLQMENNKFGGRTMDKINGSPIQGIANWGQATIAGAELDQSIWNKVVINGTNFNVAYLPYKINENGVMMPDFDRMSYIEDVERIVKEDYGGEVTDGNVKAVNDTLSQRGINLQYVRNEEGGGYHISGPNIAKFAALNVTMDKDTFDSIEDVNENLVAEIKDDNMAKGYAEMAGIKPTGGGLFSADKIVQGVVYAPIDNNLLMSSITTDSGYKRSYDPDYTISGSQFATQRRPNRAAFNDEGTSLDDV